MSRIILNFGLCFALCGTLALAASGGCSDKNGRFAVPGQCDAYIECVDGVPEEKLCPDGLLFNEKNVLTYPCSYPIEVNCEQRTKLQTAQPTDECAHQFGYYRMGDASHCGQFMNCASGKGYIVDCPEGLAWNSETYQCDWPDLVPDCDAEAFLGFKCPQIAKSELLGQEEYRFYPAPDDCQRFFICIDGHPRLNVCGEGTGFSVELNACDALENVTCSAPLKPSVKSDPSQQALNKGAKQQQASAFGNNRQQPGRQPTNIQKKSIGGAFSNSFQQQQKPQRGGAFSSPFQQQPTQRGAFQQQNTGRPQYG